MAQERCCALCSYHTMRQFSSKLVTCLCQKKCHKGEKPEANHNLRRHKQWTFWILNCQGGENSEYRDHSSAGYSINAHDTHRFSIVIPTILKQTLHARVSCFMQYQRAKPSQCNSKLQCTCHPDYISVNCKVKLLDFTLPINYIMIHRLQEVLSSPNIINSLGPKFSSQSFSLSTTLKRTPVSVLSACQAQDCSQG